MKKFFLLSFLLFACTKQSHWAFDQVHSDHKEFRSTKLTYTSGDPLHGIDLELLKTDERLNVYLNIHSLPIAPPKSDPKSAQVTIDADGCPKRFSVYRMAGGQRFLLPEDATQLLIDSFKQRKDVSITLLGHRTVFRSEDFSVKYEKVLHPFRFQNPFHLPI